MHQSTNTEDNKAKLTQHIADESSKLKEDTTDANYDKIIPEFLPEIFIATDDMGGGVKVIYAKTLKRISAIILTTSVLILSLIWIFIDYFDHNMEFTAPLILLCLPAIASLTWLINRSRNPDISQMAMGCSLTLFFGYLLICLGTDDGSAILWISIFPMGIVLGLGLRYSVYAFVLLYLFMLLLFKTTFGSIMAVPLSEGMEMRLLIICLGSFCFAWALEFTRNKTNQALLAVAYRTEQSSFTDALTGLGNRRDFDRFLAWTLEMVKRSNKPFALAVIDIDHFKKINDTYGHAAGDEVLKLVATEVEHQIRSADRLFRWGGEEFALIMPTTDMDKALHVAERVRKHIEHTPIILDEVNIRITVSLGIYAGTEHTNPGHPMHIADACLYKAKNTGRNKVVGENESLINSA